METTYTHARAHFAALCDHAASTLEPVLIHRRGAEDVALGLALLAAFASVAFMKGLAHPSSDRPGPRDP